MNFFHSLKKVTEGQSVVRTAMNQSLQGLSLRGRVLDVGGARTPDYFEYMGREGEVQTDVIDGVFSPINFEIDPLPYADAAYDTVVLCNVLEHIYNHKFLLAEIGRVLKSGGMLIGFVPFLIQYHPDPHDYFRYTNESLARLLSDAGFTKNEITPVGKGPFLVLCNTIIQGLPSFLRPIWFSAMYFCDAVFVFFKRRSLVRFPLGYRFVATK